MSKEREKGRRWDGKSRISTNQYKENWEEIFGKKEEVKRSEQWDGVSRISNDQYKKNWNDIFGKKEKKPKTRLEQMEKLTHDPIVD